MWEQQGALGTEQRVSVRRKEMRPPKHILLCMHVCIYACLHVCMYVYVYV